jgi:hypothetical protein
VLTLSCVPTAGMLVLELTSDGRAQLRLPRAEVSDARTELLFNQLASGSNTMRSLYDPVRATRCDRARPDGRRGRGAVGDRRFATVHTRRCGVGARRPQRRLRCPRRARVALRAERRRDPAESRVGAHARRDADLAPGRLRNGDRPAGLHARPVLPPNTVRHRLKRITEELGRSLTNPADIAELGAALRALNLFPEATHLPAPR